MRKLSYEIFNRNGEKINEVKTYKEAEAEKTKGNTIKSKLTNIIETLVYEIYDKEGYLVEITTLGRKKAEAKEKGYTVKARLRAI